MSDAGPPSSPSSYVEGERVFGPPYGSYDADWVASAARQADPGLPRETAQLLARAAWPLLRELGTTDPPALARRLMAEQEVGATAANTVAVAAVAFCAAYDVDPQG